jgi:hypothetical protein
MELDWLAFLRHSHAGEHAVQVYDDADQLAASVAGYVAAGLADGDPALVVVTPENWRRCLVALVGCGWDAEKAARDGLLEVVDAERVLESVLVDAGPDPALFEQVVGGMVDGVGARRPGRTVRVFGEMVDLLCARGRLAGALELEELWNRLADERRFSLLCGYHGRGLGAGLAAVCAVHTRVCNSAAA